MSAESYFNGIAAREQRYAKHGLSTCPSDQELYEYVMALEDKIDALYTAARMEPYTDYRGRTWAQRTAPGVI